MNSAQFKIVILFSLSTILGCAPPDLQSQGVVREVERVQPQQVAIAKEQPSFTPPREKAASAMEPAPARGGTDRAIQYPSTGVREWDPYNLTDTDIFATKTNTDWALLDAALALRADGRHGEAITVLEMVLAGPSPADAIWDSSRHSACLALSEIYHEQRGDLRSALRFATLSRDKYPYRSSCGLDAMAQQQIVEERIASLTQQLSRGSVQRR
ncbi:MAG: hypothetical protein H8E44_06240 [Planctomycetes bacterium]|nr:hypothetical protein [Planctomycetota bacterium]MBL7042600.1 hypothetical protein [Pirellulaceae bacterium]